MKAAARHLALLGVAWSAGIQACGDDPTRGRDDGSDVEDAREVVAADAGTSDPDGIEPVASWRLMVEPGDEACPTGSLLGEGAFDPGLCVDVREPARPDRPCRDGWSTVTVDGVSDGEPIRAGCAPDPIAETCGPGAMPVLGEPTCIPQGAACPGGAAWPPEDHLRVVGGASEAAHVWYVQANAIPDGDGSREAPFRTTAQAIALATAGDVVALSVGTHAGPVLLDAPIALVGACAGGTTLRSDEPAIDSGVVTVRAGGSRVADMTISGESPGIFAADFDGDPLVIVDTVVAETRRVGVRVAGASARATLDRVWIRDTLGSFDDHTFGRGLQVSGGATVTARSVTVDRSRDIGVFAVEEGSTLVVSGIAVRQVDADRGTGSPGLGVEAFGGASLEGGALWVTGAQSAGLSVTQGGSAELADVAVDTITDPRGETGSSGLLVGRDGDADISGLVVRGVRGGPLVAAIGPDAVVTLRDAVLTDADDGTSPGHGLRADQRTAVDLERTVIAHVRGHGVLAENAATVEGVDVDVVGVTVGEDPTSDGGLAAGVTVRLAGSVTLARWRLSDIDGRGLDVDGGIARLEQGVQLGGVAGIDVRSGGALRASDVRLEGAGRVGLRVDGERSHAGLADAWVANVGSTGAPGAGMAVQGGGVLDVRAVGISDAVGAGVLALESTLVAETVSVSGVRSGHCDEPPCGSGMAGIGVAIDASEVALSAVRIEDCGTALRLDDPASTRLRDVLVRDCSAAVAGPSVPAAVTIADDTPALAESEHGPPRPIVID